MNNRAVSCTIDVNEADDTCERAAREAAEAEELAAELEDGDGMDD